MHHNCGAALRYALLTHPTGVAVQIFPLIQNHMAMINVGLIILAAGAATRMGTPKQLLSYGGRSLILHAIEAGLASHCQPVTVVLGAYLEHIKPELISLTNLQIIENCQWQEGMSSSIRAGIQALIETHASLDAVILSLADQPLVSCHVFNQLIQHYQQTQKAIIASQYNETIGAPALFDRSFFLELMQLKGAQGAKALIQKHKDIVLSIPISEAAIDIDTPDDYEKLLYDNKSASSSPTNHFNTR